MRELAPACIIEFLLHDVRRTYLVLARVYLLLRLLLIFMPSTMSPRFGGTLLRSAAGPYKFIFKIFLMVIKSRRREKHATSELVTCFFSNSSVIQVKMSVIRLAVVSDDVRRLFFGRLGMRGSLSEHFSHYFAPVLMC